MFEEETVIILGAGASKPYDFPLGKELIAEILEDMKDIVLLPLNPVEKENYYFNDAPEGDKEDYPITWLDLDFCDEILSLDKNSLTNELLPEPTLKGYNFLWGHNASSDIKFENKGTVQVISGNQVGAPLSLLIRSYSRKTFRTKNYSLNELQLKNSTDQISISKAIIQRNNYLALKPHEQEIGTEKISFSQERGLFSYKEKFFFKTQIKNIEKFRQLYEILNDFNPVSIDIFLRDNPSHEIAAKTMIVYSLLKRENKKNFHIPENLEKKKKKEQNDWYPYFLNDITSGCSINPNKLLENKLTIVTFNYDTSLDYFLSDKLGKIESFKKNNLAKSFINKKNIYHVYGHIPFSLETYGAYFPDPELYDISQYLESGKRLHFSYRSRRNIKTMFEERKNHDESDLEQKQKIESIAEKINNAEVMIFIGFGFDRDNLDQIKLPDSPQDWKKFIKRKKCTIKWLNYENSMKGLSSDFATIHKNKNSIIESKTGSIVNAYQNDFKKSLFRKIG
ncbi:MAG: hypothetical protein K0R24_1370 [Gammaproteobacteria bacterium]|jgi:hypothetical protein|nr:hypothetical protein [Gammaproteobacteria bacterium]